MHKISTISIDSPDMRSAGRDVLSLALMDARNHTLHLLGEYEKVLAEVNFEVPCVPELNPPLWELGHIGWFAEWWLSRNLQRHLGRHADPAATRLASIEAGVDEWFNSSLVPHDSRWALELPGVDELKGYLLDTLEANLELLEKTPDDDDALYFYRLAVSRGHAWRGLGLHGADAGPAIAGGDARALAQQRAAAGARHALEPGPAGCGRLHL
jgi:hypothetical protein